MTQAFKDKIAELEDFKSKAIEALELAEEVMDYCQGDSWERECTEKARERFTILYEELKNE